MPALRPFLEPPPEAFVVDLDRRPSEGRSVAVLLRQRTATRHVPLVFAGGERDAVARVQSLLPDATFAAAWDAAVDAVEAARWARDAPPPKRGSSAREAHQHQAYHTGEGGGSWGNHGFPHARTMGSPTSAS